MRLERGRKRPHLNHPGRPEVVRECMKVDFPTFRDYPQPIEGFRRSATLARMSRLNSPSFHIGHSSGRCAATGRLLAVGEHFVVALVEPEGSDDLVRIDYSLEAWSRGSRPAPPARVFGYWKGVVLPPSAKPHALIDDEGLLDLFDQWGEQTDPRRVAFRFVLALILIRKRLL